MSRRVARFAKHCSCLKSHFYHHTHTINHRNKIYDITSFSTQSSTPARDPSPTLSARRRRRRARRDIARVCAPRAHNSTPQTRLHAHTCASTHTTRTILDRRPHPRTVGTSAPQNRRHGLQHHQQNLSSKTVSTPAPPPTP